MDLIKEPQQVITKIDMNDPLFEQKLAVAKQEEAAVDQIVKQTSDLFGAKVEIMGYNLIQNGPETRLVLTLGIARKEVTPMPNNETPSPKTAETATTPVTGPTPKDEQVAAAPREPGTPVTTVPTPENPGPSMQ